MDYEMRKAQIHGLLQNAQDTSYSRYVTANNRSTDAKDSGDEENAKREAAKAKKFLRASYISMYLRDFCGRTYERDFLTLLAVAHDDPRQVSYPRLDAGPDTDTTDDGRQRAKWSKFLTEILPARVFDTVPPHRMAERLLDFSFDRADYPAAAGLLAELIGELTVQHTDYEIELVPVGGIYDLYGDGSIHSCMVGEEYVKWYDENPDVVRAVRVTRGGSLIARALLWLDVKRTDGSRVEILDRIYPSNDSADYTRALQAWATERGVYTYRRSNDMGGSFVKDEEYAVVMQCPNRTEFPYMDSFKYSGNCPDEMLSLTLSTSSDTYTLDSTGGGWSSGDEDSDPEYDTSCEDCGDGLYDDDAYTVYRSGDQDDAVTVCYTCRRENYTRIELATDSWWVGEYVNDGAVTTCEETNSSILEDESVQLHDGRTVFAPLAVELENADYALIGDAVTLENGDVVLAEEAGQDRHGDWYMNDELVDLADGTRVHMDIAHELDDGTWVLDEELELVSA